MTPLALAREPAAADQPGLAGGAIRMRDVGARNDESRRPCTAALMLSQTFREHAISAATLSTIWHGTALVAPLSPRE
jgi:hypothetical protein